MSDGDLKVTATGDSSGFDQMLNRMKVHGKQAANEMSSQLGASWGGIGKGIAGGIAGMFSFGVVKDFFSNIAERARDVHATAEAFDISTDSVQQWEKAIGRAHLTTTTFYRALDTLRGKRQEAREDPNKRRGFFDIGMESDALGPMSDLALMQKILSSNASRPDKAALLGKKAPQLESAMKFLSSNNPALTEKNIHDLELWEQAGKERDGQLRSIVMFVANSLQRTLHGKSWIPSKSDTAQLNLRAEENRLVQEQKDKEDAALIKSSGDFVESQKQAKTDLENQDKENAANKSLREALRHNMTISQRRADMQTELLEVRSKISRFDSNPDVYSPELKVRLAGLKTREAGLLTELRDKPISFSADSMAKVGGYSESALFGNPLVSISQQQLRTLNSIDRRLAMAKSPFGHP